MVALTLPFTVKRCRYPLPSAPTQTDYLKINSAVRTVASKNPGIQFKRDIGSDVLQISGTINPRQSRLARYRPQPHRYFMTVLKETFEREGITIHGLALDGDDILYPRPEHLDAG